VQSFSASLSTQFTLGELRDLFNGDLDDNGRSSRSSSRGQDDGPEELFAWFEDFRISHDLRLRINPSNENNEVVAAHTIRLTSGNIPLSDKWGMSVGNLSYDLRRKEFVYPSFTLTRDLHCWQMRVSWQPALDTFTFFIGVKASPFGDIIKYQTGRNAFDGVRRF